MTAAAREVIKHVLPSTDLPRLGDRLMVMWKDTKGDDHREHTGVVTEIGKLANGTTLHTLEYEGWANPKDKVVVHDLAADRATGKHHWRVAKGVRPAASAQAAAPAPATAVRAGPTTRQQSDEQRQRAVYTVGAIADALEHASDPSATYEAIMDLAFGAAGDEYEEGRDGRTIDEQLVRLREDILTRNAVEQRVVACAVMAATVEVSTFLLDDGSRVTYKVPKGNAKGCLDKYPDCAEWKEMDRRAFYDSILALPGNELITEEQALKLQEELGIEILRVRSVLEIREMTTPR